MPINKNEQLPGTTTKENDLSLGNNDMADAPSWGIKTITGSFLFSFKRLGKLFVTSRGQAMTQENLNQNPDEDFMQEDQGTGEDQQDQNQEQDSNEKTSDPSIDLNDLGDGLSLNDPTYLEGEPGNGDGVDEVTIEEEQAKVEEQTTKVAIESLTQMFELQTSLIKSRTVSRGFALEANSRYGKNYLLSPNFYTNHPSITNYDLSVESLGKKISDGFKAVIEKIRTWLKSIFEWLFGGGSKKKQEAAKETTAKIVKTHDEKVKDLEKKIEESSDKPDEEKPKTQTGETVSYEFKADSSEFFDRDFEPVLEKLADFSSSYTAIRKVLEDFLSYIQAGIQGLVRGEFDSLQDVTSKFNTAYEGLLEERDSIREKDLAEYKREFDKIRNKPIEVVRFFRNKQVVWEDRINGVDYDAIYNNIDKTRQVEEVFDELLNDELDQETKKIITDFFNAYRRFINVVGNELLGEPVRLMNWMKFLNLGSLLQRFLSK